MYQNYIDLCSRKCVLQLENHIEMGFDIYLRDRNFQIDYQSNNLKLEKF